MPSSKGIAATDAEISSGETHPQAGMKADVAGAGAPAYAAPSKSGGSELFDALLMAATGALIAQLSALTVHEPLAALVPLNPFALPFVLLLLKSSCVKLAVVELCKTCSTLFCKSASGLMLLTYTFAVEISLYRIPLVLLPAD